MRLLLGVIFNILSVIYLPAQADDTQLLYEKLQLAEKGLSVEVFELALKGFSKLKQESKVKKDILTIIDFELSSTQERLWIVDLKVPRIILQTYVAHGKNTGEEFATDFSNQIDSKQSSLGFYVTLDTYTGSNGLSLRLQGMEAGFNDNAFERYIVMHGASYATAEFIRENGRLGRSHGCPAIPLSLAATVLPLLAEGSAIFTYYPDHKYLDSSRYLNP